MAGNGIQINCNRYDGASMFVFHSDELKNVRIEQKTNIICSSIPISTASFTIVSPKYYYEKGQSFSIYPQNASTLNQRILKTHIKTAKKTDKNTWQIYTEDAVGLLEDADFFGGVYFGKKTQKTLLTEILKTALKDDDFEIIGDFSEPVFGHLPYTNCREALKQVCFSCQAVVDTSVGGKLRVLKIQDQPPRNLELNELRNIEISGNDQGLKAVSLCWHTFEKSYDTPREEIAKISIFDEKTSKIFFNKPYFDLDAGNTGTILESGDNYAIVERTGAVTLTGIPYSHGKGRLQKTPTYGEITGESTIENATLVTESAAQSILDSCYNYINSKRISAQIIEKRYAYPTKYGEFAYGFRTSKYGFSYSSYKPVNQLLQCAVPVDKEVINGIIESQKFNLINGALLKNCEIVETI